ncbi:tetratricopeptide repeat protein [Neolewinella aurantiaca]|uniref:Tetratricopeptide repeat protein n=1 Tax=Neolewinella aurantiaca TaxID=2602767 RepID=A0A5C7FVL3_9BACT|nr:histidine kinase [Neolewinella aurantiaca]TXF90385.1 tetratricopeptide repeat protein [Neolewinella aurantiaca]
MSIRLFILAFLFSVASALTGQSVESSLKTRTKKVSRLQQATDLREKDPAEAIRLLNQVIQQKPGADELTDAFILLGDIYADIGQEDLAVGRYDRALEVISVKDQETQALVMLRRGTAYLRQENFAAARENFARCLDLAPASGALHAECTEGLADLESRLNNISVSNSYYEQVKFAAPDSLTQSRVNIKQASNYLQQNNIEEANNSLNEALTQVPKNAKMSKEDAEGLYAVNSKVRSAVIKEAPNLDVDVVEALPAAPLDLVTADNLTRFKALRDVGKVREAEDKLEIALKTVDSETPATIASELYAAGADFYLDRRQPGRAAEVYRNYTTANDQLLAERRKEIDQQVAVLREQQKIDLGLKDLRAAEVEGALLNDRVNLQRWLIYLLGALLIGALLSVFLILRNVGKRRRANQALLLRNLQTRMNPHFIFNSLNSINNYIAQQDERSANRYLGRFAKLMRNVLDQSGKDFVSLSEELEQLALYLELEKERFTGKFDYLLPDASGLEDVQLPPMILQPFVENAIWHGLRYRPSGGQLSVDVERDAESVLIRITDNGIGRNQSAKLKTKNQLSHKSTGMETTAQRLDLINAYYGKNFSVEVEDAFPGTEFPGTLVRLRV